MTIPLTEAELIHELRGGKREAWAALCERYGERVWCYVARCLGSDSAAVGDVVQEILIAAARSARGFDQERGSIWAWLSGISQRHVALHWRHTAHQQRLVKAASTMMSASGDDLIDGLGGPLAQLEQQELAWLVRRALNSLSEAYATVLIARYLDERSIEEISEELGETYEAVRSRLARARQEFRRVFEGAEN